ncbi:Gfo/Idh/MocA family oxidoreductase [Salinimicrobium tongyeongense]|uniref:Gfo/Idh/MocA family oxidoreductase n=1 Tax=Salinimicrobium tongyeongense TaxID=2809707 RepID=A0ABY6NSG9_9FLAO|nr:Gfo/Idh/MocA family oxidoreductase [Salinimicrobium tongyeongense]UZH55516.1 Gfo/Idh/MocA family oxidoreductase [Salinimicrobium tongyeongense]
MAKEKIRLGVIGMSPGNGHPYSWSAIFNGYERGTMNSCPFPAIPDYLNKRSFPEDSLGEIGEVTHIWTQDYNLSSHIAQASKIPNVVRNLEQMLEEVDAVLLARDDAALHYDLAIPFLKASIPIFIDKPLALSVKGAQKLLAAQEYSNQIFSCTSLRFAKELQLTYNDLDHIGTVRHIEASVPKKWDTYAVHIIEPIIAQLPNRGALKDVIPFNKNGMKMCLVEWERISAYLKVTGSTPCPLQLEFFGEKGSVQKRFINAYDSFKASLQHFVLLVKGEASNVKREETLEVIEIIEKGRK